MESHRIRMCDVRIMNSRMAAILVLSPFVCSHFEKGRLGCDDGMNLMLRILKISRQRVEHGLAFEKKFGRGCISGRLRQARHWPRQTIHSRTATRISFHPVEGLDFEKHMFSKTKGPIRVGRSRSFHPSIPSEQREPMDVDSHVSWEAGLH